MKNKIIDGVTHALGLHGFDYDQIDDRIFIGTNMCCQFGFNQELLSQGVRADISLEAERVDAPEGVDYFLWLPTQDKHAPTSDKLTLGVQTIAFLVERKVKVYLHCKNGHGRAPTLFVAYLLSTGMKLEDALALLKSKRPTAHINKVQLNALKKFAHML